MNTEKEARRHRPHLTWTVKPVRAPADLNQRPDSATRCGRSAETSIHSERTRKHPCHSAAPFRYF